MGDTPKKGRRAPRSLARDARRRLKTIIRRRTQEGAELAKLRAALAPLESGAGPQQLTSAAIKRARELSAAGEVPQALDLLKLAEAALGTDERILRTFAHIEGAAFGKLSAHVHEGLLALLPRSSDPVATLSAIVRFTEIPQLRDALASLSAAQSDKQNRAAEVLTQALGAIDPEADAPHSDSWATDLAVLRQVTGWSTRHMQTAPARKLAAALGRLDVADGDADADALARGYFYAARMCLAHGDLTEARRLSTRANELADSAELREQLVRTTSEEELALQGWPVEDLRRTTPLRPHAAGTVGYLLYRSLPYGVGGYVTRSSDVSSQLASAGWHVRCVTRPGYPMSSPDGRNTGASAVTTEFWAGDVPYTVLPGGDGLSRRERADEYAQRLIDLDSVHHWQLLHAATDATNGLAAVKAAHVLGIPSVYEVRGLWHLTRAARFPGYERTQQFEMLRRLEVDVCNAADKVLTLTAALRDLLVEEGVDAGKIELVPNGVDFDGTEISDPSPALAARLGLTGKVVIGYVGSLLNYEGLDVLLRAFERVQAERANTALLIVGDGEARVGLESLAAQLGLGDAVHFTGRLPRAEAMAHYAHIDIAPFPRLSFPVTETVSPLKPFEAMAWSKAIVASDVAPLREIVDDGSTGLLTRAGDARSLAAALVRLVDDAPLREALGTNAHAWGLENRDWSVITRRISAVYESLGARRA